jgi:hypothetical protein
MTALSASKGPTCTAEETEQKANPLRNNIGTLGHIGLNCNTMRAEEFTGEN